MRPVWALYTFDYALYAGSTSKHENHDVTSLQAALGAVPAGHMLDNLTIGQRYTHMHTCMADRRDARREHA